MSPERSESSPGDWDTTDKVVVRSDRGYVQAKLMDGYTPLEGSPTSLRHLGWRKVLLWLMASVVAVTIGTLVTTAIKVVFSVGYKEGCLHFMHWRWIMTTIWFSITQGGGFWLSFWLGSPPKIREPEGIDGVPPAPQIVKYATPETFRDRLRMDPSTAIVAGVILLITGTLAAIMIAFVEVLVVGIIVAEDRCQNIGDVWLWLWLCVGAFDLAALLVGLTIGYTRDRFVPCCDPLCR